jgi:hypothetical protein
MRRSRESFSNQIDESGLQFGKHDEQTNSGPGIDVIASASKEGWLVPDSQIGRWGREEGR